MSRILELNAKRKYEMSKLFYKIVIEMLGSNSLEEEKLKFWFG